VPTIPGSAIGPFLTQPLVAEVGGMDALPRIVATEEERVIVGAGNTAYVSGMQPSDGINWQVFRPGETLTDPETGEVLGVEAIHVGDARVKRFGSPSTIEITRAKQEINQGDRLMPAREGTFPAYVPHAPDKPIRGQILSVRGSVADISQYSIVSINRGSRDGVEVGHVLASVRRGDQMVRETRTTLFSDLFGFGPKTVEVKPVSPVPDTVVAGADPKATPVTVRGDERILLPDERSGLVFIFRTFEKISYGMVLKSVRPISVGDVVQTP
jgi:hypothetical protein